MRFWDARWVLSQTTFLGPPLGAPYKSSRVCEGVEERFQKGLLGGRDSISQKVEDEH